MTTPALPEVTTGSTVEQAAQNLLARWQGKQATADASAAESEDSAQDDGEESQDEQSDEDDAEAGDNAPEAQTTEPEYELEFGGSKFKLKSSELKDRVAEIQAKAKDLEGGATRKFQEAAELRKSLEAEREQIQQLGKLAVEHTELLADMRSTQREIEQLQGVDWNALSDSDPVTAQKAMARLMTLQNSQQRIGAGIQNAQRQMQARDAEIRSQQAQRGNEQLKALIPSLSDATKAELSAYVAKRDLTPAGREALWDPEVVAAFHDAMKYRAMQSAKPEAKRAVEAPRTLTPGKAVGPQSGAQKRVQTAREAVRTTGKTHDVANLFLARMKAQR